MIKSYTSRLLLFGLPVLLIDCIANYYFQSWFVFLSLLRLDMVVFFLFLLGIILIAPALQKDPKNFVGKFLILTTVQMLSIMSVFAAIVFVKFQSLQFVILHTLAFFVALMIIQSVLLVKLVNKNK